MATKQPQGHHTVDCAGKSWVTRFGVGCWLAWKWRNLSVHDLAFCWPLRGSEIVSRVALSYGDEIVSALRPAVVKTRAGCVALCTILGFPCQ